jgi:hypothetical protein
MLLILCQPTNHPFRAQYCVQRYPMLMPVRYSRAERPVEIGLCYAQAKITQAMSPGTPIDGPKQRPVLVLQLLLGSFSHQDSVAYTKIIRIAFMNSDRSKLTANLS